MTALKNHPQVELAKAKLLAAQEEESSQVSGYFPELSMNAAGGRIYGDNATTRGLTTTRGAAYSNYWEAGVSASQPLFDGFETLNRVRAAAAERKSANMSIMDVHEQIAYRTVQAYLNVAQSRIALNMLADQRAKVQDYLKRIEGNVEQGGSDEAELQQAKDVLVILDGFVADYNGQKKIAESQYLEMVGNLPPTSMKKPELAQGIIPPSPQEAFALAEKSHPSIQSATLMSKAAKHQIEAEEGLLYPDFSGELSYLQSDKKEEIGGEIEDAKALVRMNWQFETGGGQLARIRKKKQELHQARAQESELTRQIQRDIGIAYAERDTAATRYKNNAKRYALNKKLLETYNVQFDGGRVSLLQLMQADNQLFNTKLEAILSQYRLMAAEYGILAGMGRLKETLMRVASVNTTPDNPPNPEEIKADEQQAE